MPLYVAYFRFKDLGAPLLGLQAFERRRNFEHPPQARVIGEFWVNAPAGDPQVVVVWEADDDGPADYYEAAWGDLFDITTSMATLPVTELPATLTPELQDLLDNPRRD